MSRSRPITSRATAASLVAALGLCVGATSCFFGTEGKEPPAAELYFPTGVLVSPGSTTLYVANSDFDLRYSGGSLMVLDLPNLRRTVAPIVTALQEELPAAAVCQAATTHLRENGDLDQKRLATVSFRENADEWLYPGPCGPIPIDAYIRNVAYIGAFASGLLLTHEPDGSRARLFAPVRGDPSITYFDVDDDRLADPNSVADYRLDCGQAGDFRTQRADAGSALFCNADHRVGQDPSHNLRGLQLPADPVGIAATADGRAIVAAHQTQSAASLVINDWDSRPELSYFIPNLAAGPTEVAAIPEPKFVAVARERAQAADRPFIYRSGFAVSYIAEAQLDLLRYVPDSGSVPPRPFIQRELAVGVFTTANGFDSRGVAIVDTERRACEQSCDGVTDDLACLTACAENIPIRIYMANRDPASLLVGDMRSIVNRAEDDSGQEVITSATEDVFFFDSVPLDFGASRLEVGHIVDETGAIVERVFAVAFDTRRVFIFDPFQNRMEAVIRTGRGPHDIGFDVDVDENGEPFGYLYVGHFTDSYLGVVDLDKRHGLSFGNMVASFGVPNPPDENN